MLRYIGHRLMELVPVLFGLSIVSFGLMRMVPGDPVTIILGIHARPAAVENLRHALGLDVPVWRQYVDFVRGALTLNFGTSIQYRQPVTNVIGPRVVPSLLLVTIGLAIAVAIAVPLALVSAHWRDGLADNAVRVFTTATFAMPSFWIGLWLILLGSVRWGLFPSSGYGQTWGEHIVALILPGLAIGLGLVAPLVRSLRSTLIENLRSEYVEAAQARGIRPTRLLFKHVFRNSLMSTVTLVGLMLGGLVGATVVVENVFAIPGLGSLMVNSVSARDFPVVQALTLLFGVFVVAASLLTDLVYVIIDPRVRR